MTPFLQAAALLLVLALACLSISTAEGVTNMKNIKGEAIERGYAEYCTNSGVWTWKGECK